jgi:hypothetical protein
MSEKGISAAIEAVRLINGKMIDSIFLECSVSHGLTEEINIRSGLATRRPSPAATYSVDPIYGSDSSHRNIASQRNPFVSLDNHAPMNYYDNNNRRQQQQQQHNNDSNHHANDYYNKITFPTKRMDDGSSIQNTRSPPSAKFPFPVAVDRSSSSSSSTNEYKENNNNQYLSFGTPNNHNQQLKSIFPSADLSFLDISTPRELSFKY